MTPEVEKVLAEATPRPWDIGMMIRGELFGARNCDLVFLAVNSYETDQERIWVLTEALQGLVDAVTRWKTPKDFGGFLNNAHIQAIAALSQSKPEAGDV